MGKKITRESVMKYITGGETILESDNIIVVTLDKDVDVESAYAVYKVLHEIKPNAKILVMSENWLSWVKGGNESDELLIELVKAYETYMYSQEGSI